MKLYLLSRVLGAADRKTQVVLPMRAFQTMEVAQQAAKLRTQALHDVMKCRLVHPVDGDLGITLGQFVDDLGIVAFQHVVDAIEVHEGDITVPEPPSIILP
jgi:hypothetical protein